MKSHETVKSYTGSRGDVIRQIDAAPRKVLDVGCSDGSLGLAIKQKFPNAEVHGIEFDHNFAMQARAKLASVVQADIGDFDLESLPKGIDLLIFADVLEHTSRPQHIMKKIADHCATDDAWIVLSVPNVQHITVIGNLITGVWPERDRGIFDRTHLRWFTLRSIHDLATHCGFQVDKIARNYRLIDRPGGRLNRMAKLMRYFPLKNFFTYQYVVRMKRSRQSVLAPDSRGDR